MQSEAVETCLSYNRQIAHVLTTVDEKLLCAWMSATRSLFSRATSLQRELDICLIPQLLELIRICVLADRCVKTHVGRHTTPC